MASTLTPQMEAKIARATRTLTIAPIPVRITINFDTASANSHVFDLNTPTSKGVSINDQANTPNMVIFVMRSSVILAGMSWSSVQSRSDGSSDCTISTMEKTASSLLTAASGFRCSLKPRTTSDHGRRHRSINEFADRLAPLMQRRAGLYAFNLRTHEFDPIKIETQRILVHAV